MPDVAAVIVTRGDVDLSAIVASIRAAGITEVLVWDNSTAPFAVDDWIPGAVVVGPRSAGGPDLSVYGRYAAIADTDAEWIYVQDDDVIVSDPAALVSALGGLRDAVLCNMPAAWRAQEFYERHALVGFGAAFHRDLPAKAFEAIGLGPNCSPFPEDTEWSNLRVRRGGAEWSIPDAATFHRCCDVVFTALTDRFVVDLPYENLPWATGADRMYRRPEHFGERKRMLELALLVAEIGAAAT